MNYIAQTPTVPLAELSHSACHYPLGDPRDDDFGYCGAAAKIGSRYCERHHQLCYIPSVGRVTVPGRPPVVADTWTAKKGGYEPPLTIWRPRPAPEPIVALPLDLTSASLAVAQKEREARVMTAAVNAQNEAWRRKQGEEESRQTEAERERAKERARELTLIQSACAVGALLRGFADGIRGGPKKVRIADIQKAVAAHYYVRVDDIQSHRRTAAVVMPRQVAMYLARMLTLRSLPEIGRRFGGRDHTTVLHAVRKIEALIQIDPILAAEVEELRMALAPAGSLYA